MAIGINGYGRVLRGITLCALLFASATAFAEPRFAFISHAPDSDAWWNTMRNALKHGAEDFGVKVDYLNPKTGDIAEMAKIIDEAAAEKYDGMITTIADYAVLKDRLKAVVDKRKIPLITVNSGTEEQSEDVGAVLHIGQPEHFAGLKAGQKAASAGIKTFVCLNHYATNVASHERCQGFADGLGAAKFEELKLTGDATNMQNQITAYLASGNEPEAFLALGPSSAHPALAALKTAKLMRQPYFATFDLSSQINDGIRKGAIAFAIDQQPYLQGYLAVGILSEWIKVPRSDLQMIKFVLYSNSTLAKRMSKYGLTLLTYGKRHINSGPGFVTRSNLDKVETFSGTYR